MYLLFRVVIWVIIAVFIAFIHSESFARHRDLERVDSREAMLRLLNHCVVSWGINDGTWTAYLAPQLLAWWQDGRTKRLVLVKRAWLSLNLYVFLVRHL